jgi:hypothetical protein
MSVYLVAFDPHQALEAFSQIRSRTQALRLGEQPVDGNADDCPTALRRWYREMTVVFPSRADALDAGLPDRDALSDYAFSSLSIGMEVTDALGSDAERRAMDIANRTGVAVMNLSAPVPRCFWPV